MDVAGVGPGAAGNAKVGEVPAGGWEVLSVVATPSFEGGRPWDYGRIRYATTDLAELTRTAAQLPEPLIRSQLLFAPARILPSTMERTQDRNRGRYVAIQLTEGAKLIDAAREGSGAALQVRAALEISVRAAATPELPTKTLTEGVSHRELEPATGLGGPDPF